MLFHYQHYNFKINKFNHSVKTWNPVIFDGISTTIHDKQLC